MLQAEKSYGGWRQYQHLRSANSSSSRQEAVLQVRESSSTIRFSFDEFETVDVSLYRSSTLGKRESCENRGFVPLDAAGKGEEFPQRGCTHVFEPVV